MGMDCGLRYGTAPNLSLAEPEVVVHEDEFVRTTNKVKAFLEILFSQRVFERRRR
jgi:hypothetical protein